VVAEGWWDPYGPEYKHIMYSASKTFTATAVGFAVSENRLRLTDKVMSFFPYSLPDTIGPLMRELTVQNLLTMSVGQNPEPRSFGNNGDWIKSFLDAEPLYKPGSVFMYNNMATFMLSAIVQQVTGQTIYDYLQPRLFRPLNIRGIDWDQNPQGINLGMIGLRLHTEDMAKFGQLLMQNGLWNGKQIIPKAWVSEALSYKISTENRVEPGMKDRSDWTQGYCYQMWRGRNNTVRLDGMGGQFVVLIPDKDAIVVMTANAASTQKQLDHMHNYLIPGIKSDGPLKPALAAADDLSRREASLQIPSPGKSYVRSNLEKTISGREFMLDNNSHSIQSVYLTFNEEGLRFIIKRDNKLQSLKAGSGQWVISNSESTSLLAPLTSIPAKSVDASYKVTQYIVKAATQFGWTDEKTLEITARFVEESLGSQTVVCRFTESGGDIRMTMETKAPSMAGRPGMIPAPAPLTGRMLIP
jgi:CubicO group peptidase (beta-lactamase class C family)